METDISNNTNNEQNSSVHGDTIPANATCRICRGEGTLEIPLFHPCKCKGSIKYLHEPCLLEWIASRNLDISKPGSTVNCDICHYPFQFKTTYIENMPDKIPLHILITRSLSSYYANIKSGFIIFLAGVLLILGIPLTWNLFGKLDTIILDDEFTFSRNFWKNIVFGHESEIPDITMLNIVLQLLENIKFSTFQIVLVVVLHLALYFQYDMIVREDVFNKMIFHKIGPNISMDDLKARLGERFPMMGDDMLEHVANAMRERGRREQERAAGIEQPQAAPVVLEEPIVADIAEHLIPHQHNEDDEENDPDFVPHDEDDDDEEEEERGIADETLESDSEDENELHGLGNNIDDHVEGGNLLDRYRERFIERRRAQREFDDLIDEQRRDGQDGNIPIVIPPVIQQVPEPQQAQQAADVNIGQQVGPIVLNVNLKLTNVLVYFSMAVIFISFYLFISYFIPTVIGYLLLRLYIGIFSTFLKGLVYIFYFSRLNKLYSKLELLLPLVDDITKWATNNVINVVRYYYDGYISNSLRSSIIVRGLPALTTYLTAISIVCIASEVIARGYGRDNGMPNRMRRLIFQILFALKCTFKVFTLFFIELAGFPILAGVMLDTSLFSPILNSPTSFLWVTKITTFGVPGILVMYWIIGTLYMYWFAKYIGMIRQHIIRPGVLFFIRSPDDPNIKILHDSLIHPMNIQLSRLCLSMFIYAVFILLGFGFHTRLLFPVILKLDILRAPKAFGSVDKLNIYSLLVIFFFAKRIIEVNPNVRDWVKYFWTKIFEVGSSRLRLSSFILGNEYPMERGHILYRNLFYKIITPSKAQWSNPDLYSNPKTLNQAKKLFRENKDIHAYFIPDGILMRVPSSDIVSRNYVQTMFVPVTKDDKLLKPLDLKLIKEKNDKNAGEFGYLDHQNTDYDEYFICYVPPNFRARYISLISLIWLFASLLLLGVAVLSQFTTNTLSVVTILPILKLFGSKEQSEAFIRFIGISYKQLNVQYVLIGATILSFAVDLFEKYNLSRFFFNEHADESGESEEEGIDAAPENVREDNRPELVDLLFENWMVKAFSQPAVYITTSCIRFIRNVVSFYLITYSIKYILRISFNISTLGPSSEGLFGPVNTAILYVFLLFDQYTFSAQLYKSLRTVPDGTLFTMMKTLWHDVVYPSIISSLIICGTPFVVTTFFGVWEYSSQTAIHYDSFSKLITFFMFARVNVDKHNPEWTLQQHLNYIILTVLTLSYATVQITRTFKTWFGETVQHVKDEVYAQGRSLENYGNLQ